MRRRRWRWVAVGFVVLAGLFLAIDVVVLQYLESRGAAEIARTMSAEEATIDLGGFPFVPRFMGGKLSDVSVRVKGASASGGLRVQSIEARMETLEFSAGKLFALARSSFATRTQVTVTQPFGLMELGEQDLEDFIRRVVPIVGDVRVKGSGIEVRFFRSELLLNPPDQPTKDDLTKPARYLPAVVDGRLQLRLIGVSQVPLFARSAARRLEGLIELPKVPSSLSAEVSMRDRVVVVEAQGAKTKLTVGEATPS